MTMELKKFLSPSDMVAVTGAQLITRVSGAAGFSKPPTLPVV